MAELKLYNTLTRSKDVFTPIDAKNVRVYACGPTVYDFAHIGNARPVIVFDVLFRLLRHLYGEAHVTYARNITDVDDKINARAVRDFPGLPLNEAIRKVTEATAAQFHADVKALGCLEPTHEPRATDHIGQMIDIIGRLLDNGYAYIAQGAEGREVLFSVGKMPRYGELSNRKLEEQREGARVAVEPHKKNSGDFVLWKESSASEPGWNAEFTPDAEYRSKDEKVAIYGRPGWHIECSAMSMATLLEPLGGGLTCDDPLKNTFDIHAGGLDLIFPHHENEIAQSCCAFGKPGQPNALMAQVWMHNGFLQVEGQKMSKSLGNFVTINELLATGKFGGHLWDGDVVRLAMLKTHYRQPIDWTVSLLVESEANLRRFLDVRHDFAPTEACPIFKACLLDDLNTKEAIDRLLILVGEAEKGNLDAGGQLVASLHLLGLLMESMPKTGPGYETISASEIRVQDDFFDDLRSFIPKNAWVRNVERYFDRGIKEANWHPELKRLAMAPAKFLNERSPIDHAWSNVDRATKINSLIAARLAAREAKNFAESDRIRDELVAMGIQIMDSKDYVSGKLQTTWEVKR